MSGLAWLYQKYIATMYFWDMRDVIPTDKELPKLLLQYLHHTGPVSLGLTSLEGWFGFDPIGILKDQIRVRDSSYGGGCHRTTQEGGACRDLSTAQP